MARPPRTWPSIPRSARCARPAMALAIEMTADKARRTPYPWHERRGLASTARPLPRRPVAALATWSTSCRLTSSLSEQIDYLAEWRAKGIDLATRTSFSVALSDLHPNHRDPADLESAMRLTAATSTCPWPLAVSTCRGPGPLPGPRAAPGAGGCRATVRRAAAANTSARSPRWARRPQRRAHRGTAGQPDSPFADPPRPGPVPRRAHGRAIQKATELGVAEITLRWSASAARCASRTNAHDKRLQHWRQVAISACNSAVAPRCR